jgi:hypothetical protein
MPIRMNPNAAQIARKRALGLLAVAGASASIVIGLAGQTGASRFALAQVLDPRGKPLVDIGVDDFVVQEAGVDRELLDVRVADYPIVLVIDNGAAAGPDFDLLRKSAARFLTRLGPRPVAIVTTAGTPARVASFEDERGDVMSKLDGVDADATAPSETVRAAALAGELIKGTGTLFSTIVLATASPAPAPPDVAEPLAPIVDSRAVVHVVANVGHPGAGDRLLRGIAEQTHGDYIPIYAAASYQPAFDRLAARLTTEMLIEYIVPPGSKAVDVRIGVRVPGARVRGLGVAPR